MRSKVRVQCSSVRLSVCLSYRPQQQRAVGLLLGAPRAGDRSTPARGGRSAARAPQQHGSAAWGRSVALSSRCDCEQCRVYSRRRRLKTDLSITSLRLWLTYSMTSRKQSPIESGRTVVTAFTRDTLRISLFVFVWLTEVRFVVLRLLVGCMSSPLTNRSLLIAMKRGSCGIFSFFDAQNTVLHQNSKMSTQKS